ncbi:hypothetical protein [uncultured Williamsia sp.]|uniref:hypothetical protein n=1 Tax=uncultured Williamsia sp. TaxID=259311 RepID=UPI00261E9792|nr:hypothetical protein [uncultured Williamsia sp.]
MNAHVDDPTEVVTAQDPDDLLLRAIALAAQGRYARAAADLQRVLRDARSTDGLLLRSAARCAVASHRRQAGGHRRALVDDGAAVASAVAAPDGAGRRAALVDALTGLAADRLGVGDLAGSDRLLGRAEAIADDMRPDVDWVRGGRPVLRTAWVRAEWHLYSGRGTEAYRVAVFAADLAADCPSARHRLKTDLLLAACSAASGDIDRARDDATDVASRADALDQRPLAWAAWGLLIDLAPDPDERAAAGSRHEDLGRWLRRQGGGFASSAT